ncbi:RICIN domain-containing protein [Streptacidiphilus sp. PAMC 29251]
MDIRKTAGLLLSAAALAVGLGITVMPGAAQAAVTPPGGEGWSELTLPLLSNSVCLDVTDGSTSPGVPLQMYHCHGYAGNGAPQRWVFVPVGDGSYKIYNQSDLLCVTPKPPASRGQTKNLVEQLPCGQFAGQDWRLVALPSYPSTVFQLESATGNGTCLAGAGGDHATIYWEPCSTTTIQAWRLG